MEKSVSAQVFNPSILIPVYNHQQAISQTLNTILTFKLPVLLVDDGSSPTCHTLLEQLAGKHSALVCLVTLPSNRGKGAAVKAGLLDLEARSYSHALQIDADGQHDLLRLPAFLDAAKNAPTALINSSPLYDKNIPKLRYLGRYLTHVWVWINTLSLQIKDSMCGFRVYPVKQTNRLLHSESTGNRMEFDIEILVRWCWRGYSVTNIPIAVHYPIDGISHFHALRDNALISWAHTRLFFGMLLRLPTLLRRKTHD